MYRMEQFDGIAASLRALGTAQWGGPVHQAARRLGAAEALRERVGGAVPPWHLESFDRAVERLRSGLGR